MILSNMKFGKQLFLIFAVTTAVPLMIMWFLLGKVMYQKEITDVSEKQSLVAQNLGAALQRYQKDLKSGFEVASKNLVAGNDFTNVKTFTAALNFQHFCIADIQTGRIVAQAAPKNLPCPEKVSAKRLTVFNALATTGEPVFSPVMAGPENQPFIYLLQKFDNKLAIGAIRTDYFVELAKAVTFGKTGHAIIVDQDGNVLAHPKPKWIAARKNIAEIPMVKSMMAGKTGTAKFFSPAFGVDMMAGFTSIKGAGWGVMIPQPVAELQAAAKVAHGSVFQFMTTVILLAGLMALLVARMVMKPLNNMIKIAKAVEHGDPDVTIRVDDSWHIPQEFKDMQKRFNAMARAVSKYQNEQNRERQAAEADSKTKAEYFANLAHELKTPLNSILGFSSVLRQAKPGSLKPAEEFEFLGHIEKSAGHLLTFVNDLLDLNRLDMGAHHFNEQEFRLIDPIRFCVATLRKQIDSKNIEVTIECPHPDLKLLADERSINQILINLVGNAVRYSFDKGKIKISTCLLPNGDLKIEIHDNGIGIPEDDLEDIMLPFKRANDPQLADIRGTGLGLSIVSKQARLHDIAFTIESVHGLSTTTRLVIPKKRIISSDKMASVA